MTQRISGRGAWDGVAADTGEVDAPAAAEPFKPAVVFSFCGGLGPNVRAVRVRGEDIVPPASAYAMEWQDGVDALGAPVWRPLDAEVLAVNAPRMLEALHHLVAWGVR